MPWVNDLCVHAFAFEDIKPRRENRGSWFKRCTSSESPRCIWIRGCVLCLFLRASTLRWVGEWFASGIALSRMVSAAQESQHQWWQVPEGRIIGVLLTSDAKKPNNPWSALDVNAPLSWDEQFFLLSLARRSFVSPVMLHTLKGPCYRNSPSVFDSFLITHTLVLSCVQNPLKPRITIKTA